MLVKQFVRSSLVQDGQQGEADGRRGVDIFHATCDLFTAKGQVSPGSRKFKAVSLTDAKEFYSDAHIHFLNRGLKPIHWEPSESRKQSRVVRMTWKNNRPFQTGSGDRSDILNRHSEQQSSGRGLVTMLARDISLPLGTCSMQGINIGGRHNSNKCQ